MSRSQILFMALGGKSSLLLQLGVRGKKIKLSKKEQIFFLGIKIQFSSKGKQIVARLFCLDDPIISDSLAVETHEIVAVKLSVHFIFLCVCCFFTALGQHFFPIFLHSDSSLSVEQNKPFEDLQLR